MSNYNNLKTTIDANIKQNGNQEITGPILNSVLNQMVNILGTGYQFAGVATLDPATDPGTPDAKVFYIANGKGTYTNFGGLEVTEDEVVVLYWDTAWHKVATGIASQAKLSELESKVIRLVGIGTTVAGTSGVTGVGDVYYNTTTKLLRECTSWSGNPDTSSYKTIPFIYGAIYSFGERLFYWDGSDMLQFYANEIKSIEDISGVVYDKDCFKLLYFKNTAPDTMLIGESFFNTSSNLIRRKVSNSTFETIPFDYDFYFNDETGKFYTWDGSAMVEYIGVPHLDSADELLYGKTAFDIEFIGAEGSSLAIGQSFFDTSANRIRKKTDSSTFINVPFIFDIYRNADDGKNYVWDGTTLVETAEDEEIGIANAVRGVTCYEVEKFAASGISLEYGQSFFNTKSKLIRKRISDDVYETIPFNYDLYYNKETGIYYYWDGVQMVQSVRAPQKGLSEKVEELYKPEQPDSALFMYQTDWIATSRNYILRVANGTLYHSNDLGKTWVSLPNTIGIVTFVHWFSDGTCLICGEKKAYTTKDWTALTESTIYDADGSVFVGEDRNFFTIGNYNSDICVVDGQEVAIWCDYGNTKTYVSRLWCAEQNGSVIRCILKNNESVIGGVTFSCTHFHDCVWDKYDNCLWISTGDYADTSHLLRATYNNGWQFKILQSGLDFKFAGLLVDEYYLYCMTDYTEEMDTGIKRVLKINAENASAYTFVYKTEDGTPMLNLYEDENGKKVLTPDSIPDKKGTFLYADKDLAFSEKTFVTNNNLILALHHFYGPNYNGDMLAVTSTGYGFSPGLTVQTRYLFSKAMWDAGYKDFAKGKLLK